MLALTLRKGDYVMIGGVKVTAVNVRESGAAMLGIEAPKDVRILRGKVLERWQISEEVGERAKKKKADEKRQKLTDELVRRMEAAKKR